MQSLTKAKGESHIGNLSPASVAESSFKRVLLLPPGWDANPSQDTEHKLTRGITIPPGWDVSPAQDTQNKVIRSITTPPWMGC